ncbi:hypothetical protein [Rhodohalobacter sulfatireducens]|uniref:Uncharacterized protein n=1 Tax=Rhodohalobacter sulfatireducens TaxID=2911366 RepID=A0ABS9K9K8_9BACT|nr:hypothetical protein [Rhodohalobacter sulfatireducens]MCG2587535.1 hypothetical protein [Rhodohalobacter sulfatireducens]
MYRQYSFLLVLPLIFTLSVLFFLHYNKGAENTKNQKAVNAVIGNKSFLHVFGKQPTDEVPEQVRIKTHLQYVESILRNRAVDHLTEEQQRNRFTHLNHLREYYLAGEFPHNDGHPDSRRPTFISNDGDICAVGYLIEKSLGREIVEKINQKYKYAYITDIDAPVFKEWVKSSGFTIRELGMIQPMYGPSIIEEVERNENNIDLSYGIGSSVLTAANILYHTNNPNEPWLFNERSSKHWFGLAAGSGSILIGALNFDNKRSFTETIGSEGACLGFNCPAMRKVTVKNDTRRVLSIANMGVGLVTVLRAGYHLIKRTDPREKSSSSSFGVTQLEPGFLQRSERVPALEMQVRF